MSIEQTGFALWQFSEELVPCVENFAARFHNRDGVKSNGEFSPWHILFGSEDVLPSQKIQDVDSNSDAVDKVDVLLLTTNTEQQMVDLIDVSTQEHDITPSDTMQDLTTAKDVPSVIKSAALEAGLEETQLEFSFLIPSTQQPVVGTQKSPTYEANCVVDLVELLQVGANDVDLTTIPTATLVEVLHKLSDKGLCNTMEAVCTMKPTDQARLNSTIVTHLLLPRLQKCDDRCSRPVLSAFGQFLNCCPVVGCRLLLTPLLVDLPAKHIDTVRHLLLEIKSQQHKDIILKGVCEGLMQMSDPHLSLFLLLIGPTEDNLVKQRLVKLLTESAKAFVRDVRFGKLLLTVIPQLVNHPDLKEQLTCIVNGHQSVLKNTALKLLNT